MPPALTILFLRGIRVAALAAIGSAGFLILDPPTHPIAPTCNNTACAILPQTLELMCGYHLNSYCGFTGNAGGPICISVPRCVPRSPVRSSPKEKHPRRGAE